MTQSIQNLKKPECCEEWRVIDFAPDYEVSNFGLVRSIARTVYKKDGRTAPFPSQLRAFEESKTTIGYWRVGLSINKKQKKYSVHRLVANAFLDKIKGKNIVNHKDGNPKNNHVSNLEWCTHSENNQHAIDTGLRNPYCRSSLDEAKVLEIKRLLAEGTAQCVLAKQFQVSQSTISNIKLGINWAHIAV